MKTTRKNIFAYTAVALAFVLFVVAGVTMIRPGNSAGAEAVQVTENATVVTSPFTEAVQKVHGSVVGVNNYTMATVLTLAMVTATAAGMMTV